MKHFSVMDIRGIDPHITLKYYFDEKDLPKIEGICWSMSKTHRASSFKLTGYGDFGKTVLFAEVVPSREMKVFYEDLFRAIKNERLPIDDNERDGIHFHVTLAEDVHSEDYVAIMHYLDESKTTLSLTLDTLTILKYDKDVFSVHKKYSLIR